MKTALMLLLLVGSNSAARGDEPRADLERRVTVEAFHRRFQ